VRLVVAGAALAIHPGALGDVLLAIPALRALRDAGQRVMLAAQPRLASLLVALGEADEACDFESLRLDALFGAESGARLPTVERVVCWFGARDPDFVRRLTALEPRVTVARSVSPGCNVWEHLLGTLGETGAPARRDAVRVSDALVAEGGAALGAIGVARARRLVVVHPGAGSVAKCWPAAAFAAALAPMATRRDLEIVVHEGPADGDAVAQLRRLVPSARVLREPSLPALAGVLARCAAYVGNDSGVSHLAAVVGAPMVVLFTAAKLEWCPWAPGPRVLTVAMERVQPEDVGAVRCALDAVLG
jgi:ADP-heptose:LPS heptosyltransferase